MELNTGFSKIIDDTQCCFH